MTTFFVLRYSSHLSLHKNTHALLHALMHFTDNSNDVLKCTMNAQVLERTFNMQCMSSNAHE